MCLISATGAGVTPAERTISSKADAAVDAASISAAAVSAAAVTAAEDAALTLSDRETVL